MIAGSAKSSALVTAAEPWLIASVPLSLSARQDRYAGHHEYRIDATSGIAVHPRDCRVPPQAPMVHVFLHSCHRSCVRSAPVADRAAPKAAVREEHSPSPHTGTRDSAA